MTKNFTIIIVGKIDIYERIEDNLQYHTVSLS